MKVNDLRWLRSPRLERNALHHALLVLQVIPSVEETSTHYGPWDS
jgi:hypothetical protein